MNSSQLRKVYILLACGACSAAWAQTTQPSRPELSFVIGEPRDYDGGHAPHPAATHAARVFVDQHPQNLSTNQFGNQPPLRDRAERFAFSPGQLALLKVGGVVWFTERQNRGTGEAPYVWTLFAVSEADARKMAEALLDYLESRRREENERLRARYEWAREEVAKYQKIIAEWPDKIAAVKEDQEQTEKKIEALKKVVAVTKWGEGGVGDYQIELQKLLRSINIEIAGVQAKLDAIRKLRDKAASSGVSLHLDQMQATQDVELAGAMVRKGMVETDLKNTTDYSDAMFKKGRLGAELRRLENQLESARKTLPDRQKIMEDSRQVLPLISVVGPVRIYPLIKQATTQTRPAGPPTSQPRSRSPLVPRRQ